MLSQYLPGVEQLSSHWAVVIGVGAAFLLVQLVLSMRLYVRAWRQERVLDHLYEDLAHGGDGRGGSARRGGDAAPRGFAWLRWVLSMFPAGTTTPPGNFTREQVLHELDTRITSDSSYLLLQRMGIMAPLLGVVLTVVGFYWLKIDESGEQSLQTILKAVTPLVSGVGAGAVLALLNQALLQAVGGRMERLRMTARAWFDATIWRHVGTSQHASALPSGTAEAVAALEKFARQVALTADRHKASSSQIEAATASMKLAAAQFEEVVRSFHGEIKGMPQALCVLRDATAASANALQELLPVGARAVSNLDVSVAAFRST
ncbi:MAG: hypothetical protein H0T51_11720, partial [Pirellulales bacterium]|nr:hypothetical protein [Pirellulales bacterium]